MLIWRIEIKIQFLVINLVPWRPSPLLVFVVVVAVAAVVAESEAVPQGATLFNVNYVTSQATQASIASTASIKTSNLHHLHCHRIFISPQLTIPPSYLNLLILQHPRYSHSASLATPELVADVAWYLDSRASSHVTPKFQNFMHSSPHQGAD